MARLAPYVGYPTMIDPKYWTTIFCNIFFRNNVANVTNYGFRTINKHNQYHNTHGDIESDPYVYQYAVHFYLPKIMDGLEYDSIDHLI